MRFNEDSGKWLTFWATMYLINAYTTACCLVVGLLLGLGLSSATKAKKNGTEE